MIYFVACREANAVKIGLTSDYPGCVQKRVSMLQVGCPLRLELIGAQAGDREEERALLERFASDRIHGEWFRVSAALLDHVASLEIPQAPPRPARSEKLCRKWENEAVLA